MIAILRAILALLASLGQQPPAPDPVQPIIIEPGPTRFCEPGKEWCK